MTYADRLSGTINEGVPPGVSSESKKRGHLKDDQHKSLYLVLSTHPPVHSPANAGPIFSAK